MESSPERAPSSADQGNTALIREELQRIVTSPVFARAERLQCFLRFIVEAALNGDSESVKEYVIGRQVYGRGSDYDPKSEPIVRNEARRLRLKLEQYYETLGRNDRVTINVPPGGYLPRIDVRASKIVPIQSVVTLQAPAEEQLPEPDVKPAVGIEANLKGATGVPPPFPERHERDHHVTSFSRIARTIAWILAGALIVCLAWFMFTRSPTRLSHATWIARESGYEFQPAISPDGKQVAFVWDESGGNDHIYVKLIGSADKLRLTSGSAHDVNPTWAPDGTKLAFLRVTPEKKEVFTVSSLGGAEHFVCQTNSVKPEWVEDALIMIGAHSPGPAWSPDGRYLAITDRQGDGDPDSIYFVSLQDGAKRRATFPAEGAIGDYFPAFSPDGRWLAFLRETWQRNRGGIYVQANGEAEPRQITSGSEVISGISWTSDDRLVFSSDRADSNQLWTIARGGGSPEPLEAAGRNALQPSASRDGRRLVYTEAFRYTDVWRVNIGLNESRRLEPSQLISSQGRNDSAQYSPDGKRIAFVSDRSGSQEIWICNADGSHPIQLTSSNGLPVGTPRWSPDGKKIVYDSMKDGYSAVYVVGSEGGSPALFASGQTNYLMPSWSRDGRYVYFASDDGRTFVWKKPVNGGDAVKIASDGGEVLESPDGGTVYRLKRERGIVQRAVAGGPESALPGLEDVDTSRYAAISSRGIYYLSGEQSPWVIQFYDFKTHAISNVTTMKRAPQFGTPSLSVSPDDQWMLFSQLDQSGSELMMLERSK